VGKCACAPEWCSWSWVGQIGSVLDPADYDPNKTLLNTGEPHPYGEDPFGWFGSATPNRSEAYENNDGRTPSMSAACMVMPQRQCGGFVWQVARNRGGGAYDAPRYRRVPVQLESSWDVNSLGGDLSGTVTCGGRKRISWTSLRVSDFP
jgi:hypothetical protein